jgi:geranylgeranyl pyrophosphate synthase
MNASALNEMSGGKIDSALVEQLSTLVGEVEKILYKQVETSSNLVGSVARLTLRAGGKRLRPAFVELAARATGLPYDRSRTLNIGACMELIHMATLLHDDVIDHATTRRGKPTASAEFGNTAAILSGDALLARAMRILAQDGDMEVFRAVSEAVIEMAEGEVQELELRGEFDVEIEQHLEVLRLKTASFVECCCASGALIAGAEPEIVEALKQYAHHVGMAFQIIDDLLDYRGDHTKTGKKRAGDFLEGQATLPLILLRAHLSPAEMIVARQKFGERPTEEEIRMIIDWMSTRGAFDEAQAYAERHIQSALDALKVLPETPERMLLEQVAMFVVVRNA